MKQEETDCITTEWWLAQWTSVSTGPITITVLGQQIPSQLEIVDAQIQYVDEMLEKK